MKTIDSENQDSTLAVKDLNVAAYLLASGEVTLERSVRKSRNLVLFLFSPKQKVEILINNYWSDTSSLSPRNIFAALRSLKDLIFSGDYQ
jgi:hypothetical protein